MIPTRLLLRQFLCYRDPVEVDFTGLRLACLSGENGAGKSALLDAMTWALWEKARADNHHLISLGEQDTRVEFSFLLDGTEYRVIRSYTAAGRVRSTLELHVRRDEGWYPVVTGGRQAVQREIDRLLGISYATFVNSVFLLQGRADEFTRKTPAERKRILAELLELDRYERYRELAREEARRLYDEQVRREQELASLEERIRSLPQLEMEVRALEQQVSASRTTLANLRTRADTWQERVHRLQLEVERFRERQRRRDELARDLRVLAEREAGIRRELAEHQRLLAREPDIRARFTELQRTRRALDELNDRLRQRQQLSEELRQIERAVHARRQDIERQLHAVEAQLARHHKELEEREKLIVERDRLLTELESYASLAADREALRLHLEDLQTRRAEVVAEGKQAVSEREELTHKLEQLERLEAVCPVCLRPLAEEDRQRQLEQLRARASALQERIDHLRNVVRQLDQEIQTTKQRYQTIEQQAQQERQLQAQLVRVSEQLDRLTRLEEEVRLLGERRERLVQAQQQDDELQALQARQQALEQQLAAIPYDPQEHEQLERQRRSLESAEQDLQKLERARLAIEYCQRQLAQLCEQREQRRAELAHLESELASTPSPENDLVTASRELEAIRSDIACAERRLHELQAELGAARQRLADAQRAEELSREVRAHIERLSQERAILEELERAFSKNGIQTLILENVLPELSELTNDILDRLPGNTLRVDFVTQRERASGDGAIETLDILISDEAGVRPYELFSGGEAFRINFALRVALSLLLVQRAGRRLETLVIDEGFGTQDAKGREGLIQALQAVQDRFGLILVITHLEELKEQFPQRIEVYRTAAGSRISVIA